jgi:Rrf2 family protein
MINSRLALAAHILALLAIEGKDGPTTSEYLAESANTNPVVIRRVLSDLGKAGLVNAQSGAGGGVSLARPPQDISLEEIYRSVDEGKLFSLGKRKPNPTCICGRNLQPVLTGVFSQVEEAVRTTLAGITLAQIAAEVEARDLQMQHPAG